jgi:membrane-associated PAP2 superfamily phosphatase
MKVGLIRALVIVTAALLGASLTGCKKEMTAEDCKAKCVTIGAEEAAKCTMPAAICAEAKKKGDENCNKTCDLAFPKK